MGKSLKQVWDWVEFNLLRSFYTVFFYGIPLMSALYGFQQLIEWTQPMGVSDRALIEAIHKVDIEGYLLMIGAVVGVVASKGHSMKSVAGSVVSGFALIVASYASSLTPQDIAPAELSAAEGQFIAWCLLAIFSSAFLTMWFCVLAILHVEPGLDRKASWLIAFLTHKPAQPVSSSARES